MKFTKEDAVKELKAKIPNNGQTINLSDRSINEMLDSLMPLLANDETELDAFVTSVLPTFKTADGNVRNDVSVGIKHYKDSNPIVEKPKPSEENKDANAELLRRLEELESKTKAAEAKNLINSRRTSLIAKLNEKGCKDNEWIDSIIDEVNFEGDSFDVDAKADKFAKAYNKLASKIPEEVKTPRHPRTEEDEKYLNDTLSAIVNKRKAAEES